MTKPAYIVTSNAITVIWEGKPYTLNTDNPNYTGLKNALINAEYDTIPRFLDIKKQIENFSHGSIKVISEKVYYGNHELKGFVIDKLLEFLRSGAKDAQPILNFIEKLMFNPSKNSVDQLYTFLSYKTLPLTETGNVIGYKGVDADYYSKHGNINTIVITGTVNKNGCILNKIGETIEVARNSVDDNKDNHCSHGLHIGSYDYAKDWAGNDGHLMMVEFDPSNAVSVPTDCNFQKLRVSKYKVIGEVPFERIKETEAPLNEPYYNTDEEISVDDDDDDCDDDCGCNINEGYGYSDATILAIKNYVEGRVEGGTPATLKSIQSRLKGTHISCQEIKDICLDLGFTVQEDDNIALSHSLVTIVTVSEKSDDQ
jgi:hypothetical protein